MAHKLKIKLSNTEKDYSRTILVPEDFTFDNLHICIQILFDWSNCHLYQFNLGRPYSSPSITIPNEFNEDSDFDSTSTYLKDFFNGNYKNINYIYDFGDDWIHSISVLTKPKEEFLFPVCIKSKGHNMIEDAGGIWGLENIINTINNPKNTKEKRELKDWLGMNKNETLEEKLFFDINERNEMLKSTFSKE